MSSLGPTVIAVAFLVLGTGASAAAGAPGCLEERTLGATAVAREDATVRTDPGDASGRRVPSQGDAGEGRYAANYVANRIVIVDQATNTLVTVVPAGIEPYPLAADPDGSRLYLVNRRADLLLVIDTTTYDLAASVLIGRPRVALATNQDETRLFIGNFFRDTVLIVDNPTHSIVATVAVRGLVGDLASNASGTRVYAGTLEDAVQGRQLGVAVIDAERLAVIATVRLSTVPFSSGGSAGVAINPAGTRVYIANGSVDSISVVETATHTIIATVPTGRGPDRMLFSPDGSRLYVANGFSSTVSVVDAVENTLVDTFPIGGSNSGEGIATAPNTSPGLWTALHAPDPAGFPLPAWNRPTGIDLLAGGSPC
jgi:YVTN family beta-propeller protein